MIKDDDERPAARLVTCCHAINPVKHSSDGKTYVSVCPALHACGPMWTSLCASAAGAG